MSPVRVATVITRLDGGAGVIALRGARALDPAEFAVTLVVGSGGRLLAEAADAGIETVLEPSIRPSISPRADLLAVRRLTALYRERGVDVVHTHCAKAGVVGRVAAARAGIGRIVHTYHGFPFHQYQSAGRRRAYQAMERSVGRRTNVALCVGGAVAAETIRLGLVRPERVRAIGVAVDQNAVTASPATRTWARRELGVPAAATVVGAVGRLTYQKAPEDFLAALRLVDRRSVVGVWVGGGELADRVRRLAARTLPPGRIVFAGDRVDVARLLPAFDVLALTSRYEGLPLAVVEAMICGVPVVATAVNAVPDVVIPGCTGTLVPPRRPDLLAGALEKLFADPENAAMMAAAAHAHVRTPTFGTPALGAALADSYRADSVPDSSPEWGNDFSRQC